MKKKMIIIISAIIAVVVVAFLVIGRSNSSAAKIAIETAKTEKGTISRTVSATGTLEAITTVEVGTQVSGIVEELLVDFNSYVKKGQLLAKLDTTNLAASLDQTRASLASSKAEMDYQEANYNRLLPLMDKKLISQSDFDQTLYNLNKAKANYNSALAQHKRNQINLDYAFIYSPIDGIVLNRAVEQGQTVAASFNTPTLFTIANDLTQMRVEADVDEADIGQVKQGQRVEFSVDAYPEVVFNGEVTEVRLEPTVTNNVVTYTIIISAPNPDYKLMPGLTAETNIYVLEKKELVVVPSKAIRFKPDEKLMASYMRSNFKPGEGKPELPEVNGEMIPPPGSNQQGEKTVWVKRDSMLRPVVVKTGLDDDIKVEIISGLKIGDEVILSMKEEKNEAEEDSGSRSFMPGPPGRR